MNRIVLIVLAALLLLFLLGASFSGLYTDWLWFGQVQYSGVFLTVLTTKLWLGAAGAVLLFFLLWVNLRVARWPTRTTLVFQGKNVLAIPDRHLVEPQVNRVLPVAILLISLFAGLVVGTSLWEQVLLCLHPTEFGQKDPLFNNDLGFYVFQLPLLKSLYRHVGAGLVRGAERSGVHLRRKGRRDRTSTVHHPSQGEAALADFTGHHDLGQGGELPPEHV